ncbi:MAG TPA: VOC family protein [Gammaproteobacteria bacterium]|nr:VOC family protein [Gammaproteobacteria bacterium]
MTAGAGVANFYARTVFFVSDAQRALEFYTRELGFKLDWTHEEEGRPWVFQVSLYGFELIVNQDEPWHPGRVGHGRVFLSLDDGQMAALRGHLEARGVASKVDQWGAPTLALHDMDGNEIFAWLPRREWPEWEAEFAKRAAAPPST